MSVRKASSARSQGSSLRSQGLICPFAGGNHTFEQGQFVMRQCPKEAITNDIRENPITLPTAGTHRCRYGPLNYAGTLHRNDNRLAGNPENRGRISTHRPQSQATFTIAINNDILTPNRILNLIKNKPKQEIYSATEVKNEKKN